MSAESVTCQRPVLRRRLQSCRNDASEVDVAVIGSGAGGGPLAFWRSRAGLQVLVVDKGPDYHRGDYGHDELFAALNPSFLLPSVRRDPHVLVTVGQITKASRSNFGWIASCVGGGTAHMGGAFYRLHPDDFRLRARFGEFEETVDWPYSYDDLEPYYGIAEREIGVSGAGGTNPYEGPRSSEYPMPPLANLAFATRFDAACRHLGLHPFPTPRAVNSIPYNGRPACEYCAFCAGYGCHVGARGSTQEALLPRAVGTRRCEVRSGAMVREVTVGADRRATGCLYVDDLGVIHRVRARVVCVCCSAVESARLLLLSTSPAFPNGLANGTGLVGRHLQFHIGSYGRGECRSADVFGLSRTRGLLLRSLADFYFMPSGATVYPKGGLHRFELEAVHPIAVAQHIALEGNAPVWGHALKRRLWEHFHESRTVRFEVFQDFVPNNRTFVELDPEVTDQWGLPVARIHLSDLDHHSAAGKWLTERGLEVLEAVGARDAASAGIGVTTSVMAHGTCRGGTDPRTSVVNAFCQAQEVPNLFVVDGSFMPTSGGAPSTLTILANSFRTADWILANRRSF